MFRAAHELHSREQANPTRQQHRKGPQSQAALCTGASSRRVPPRELPAAALVVDVIEEAALGDQERVRLEWTFCRQTDFVGNGVNIIMHGYKAIPADL